MSRLIIKNLPKSITEEKLRTLFEEKGTVTDIQLKYTKEGVFRKFAFIGYQLDEEADAAFNYFNNTCIQTSRIKVEKCAHLGSEEKPKSWSKYSIDSSAYQKKQGLEKAGQKEQEIKKENKKSTKKNVVEEIFGDRKNNPEFIEFLQAHDKKRTLWANDAPLTLNEEASKNVGDLASEKPQKEKRIAEDDDSNSEGNKAEHETSKSSVSEVDDETDKQKEKLADKSISDIDYMKSLIKKKDKTDSDKDKSKSEKGQVELFTIKVHGIPCKTNRQQIINFFKPTKPFSVRIPTKTRGFCYVGFKTEKEFRKAMLKDKSFLNGKQLFLSDFTEKNKRTNGEDQIGGKSTKGYEKNSKWAQQESAIKNEEKISESGSIFFRNLPYIATEDDIQKLFEKYGPIADINLPVDTITRKIKGFGTISFVLPEHAVMAFNELDGTTFHGRLLHLLPAKSTDKDEDKEEEEGLSYKAKKLLNLKKSTNTYNWNTLFLGGSAVADILAKQLGEDKETILDTHTGGSNAAVRLALGETQIVMELKKFLEENDVQLEAFEARSQKRSNTVILAKNLPADTTVAELKPLFSKYGPLGRILLPSNGVTAIIEFEAPVEAKQAFKKLAYSKFKSLPLYLEWAPENLFKTPYVRSPKEEEQKKIEKVDVLNEKKSEKNNPFRKDIKMDKEDPSEKAENGQTNEVEDDIPPEEGTTLFLRNLNFKTREDAVRNHFKHLGPIHTVQVAMKKDPEDPKNRIPLGYGFIQFKRKKTAEETLKDMHFTLIEGNQVELKRSDRTLKVETRHIKKQTNVKDQTGTKVVVRNIPFQAKLKEIREIFEVFGNIKSIRLPKKVTTGEEQHRGFGFVDFFDESTAKKAFDALCQSTHLYGRRLVLEWAETTEDDVDKLRKRTAENFTGSNSNPKRSKKAVFDDSNVSELVKVDDDDDEL